MSLDPEALARLRAVVTKYQSDLQFNPEFQDVEADLRALLDAYDTVRAEGVAAERARVLADLRGLARSFKTPATEQWRDMCEWVADRYERGEHDEEGER